MTQQTASPGAGVRPEHVIEGETRVMGMTRGARIMRSFGLAAAVALLPVVAQAATLDLATLGYARDVTVAEDAASTIIVTEDPLAPGVLQLFANDLLVELLVDSFDLSDPSQAAFVLFAADPVDELSATGAVALGTDDNAGLVQFLFEGVFGAGIYAPFDGDAVLVEVQAGGLLPFTDGFLTDAGKLTVTVLAEAGVGAIPLPAGLPLMLAGLGALAVVRRRGRPNHG